MPCDTSSIFDCTPADVVDGVIGDVASSAWEAVCKSFADAAVAMLKGFATAFAAFPNVDLTSDGVRSVYGISLGLAGFVAVLLLFFQIIRTVITHDGNPLAQAFIGLGKSALAFMVTLTVASTALVAADALTVFIIDRTFGSAEGLTTKLTTLFELGTLNSPALMLMLACIGMVLVLVLWFELLLRNAAVVVLIATSPIPAAGMMSDATKQWWSDTAWATVRLIILKPVIALVFAVGFGVFGNETKDLGTLLSGMLILLLAALAWPAIARFFTFAAAHSGGPSGLAAVLGFAAGRAADSAGAGASVTGGDPDQFGQHAEARTMAKFASRAGSGAGTGGATAGSSAAGGAVAGGSGGAVAGGAAVAAGAAGAGIPLAVAKGAEMAQRAVNSLAGRMEQTAGHAGLGGVAQHAHPAGYARPVPAMNSANSTRRPASAGNRQAEDATVPGGRQAGATMSGAGGSSATSPQAREPMTSRMSADEPASSTAPVELSTPPVSEPGSVSSSMTESTADSTAALTTDPVASPRNESAALPEAGSVLAAEPGAPNPVDAPALAESAPAAPWGTAPLAADPSTPPAAPPVDAVDPQIPRPRPVSPVEHLRPEPQRTGQIGPVQHVRPFQSSPVEHQKGDES